MVLKKVNTVSTIKICDIKNLSTLVLLVLILFNETWLTNKSTYTIIHHIISSYVNVKILYLNFEQKKSPNSFELGLKEGGDLLFHKCSTIGANGLNFSVRKGKR